MTPARQRVWALTVMGLALLALLQLCTRYPDAVLAVSSLSMIAIGLTTLAFQLYAWRTPESSAEDAAIVPSSSQLRIAIFLAARREAAVLGSTLEQMTRLRHPDYLICVIIDHRDDPDTLAIAREYEQRHPDLVRVVAYPDVPRSSKPIGLNEAMRVLLRSEERWDVVGVADAEDHFHSDLLATVDHLFREKGPGIVQGAVQLVNYSVQVSGHHLPEGYLVALATRLRLPRGVRLRRLDRTRELRRLVQRTSSGWWRAANCLEYYKWFSSRLKMQAAARVMPLGGNTVFFSRAFLDALHQRTGTWWDEDCLTEDCKIGILASVLGFGVEVFSRPELATLEETPATLPKFVRQRVRWMQGFVQVFFELEWLHLPTARQRLLAVYVLGFQFFQAAAGVLSPISLAYAFCHKAPMPLVLLAFVPLIISGWNVVIDLLLFRDFAAAYTQTRTREPVTAALSPTAATGTTTAAGPGTRQGRNAHPLDYCGIVIGNYLFQIVLSLAAVGAIYRSLAGITNWVKTDHSGAHLVIDLTEHEGARSA
jgi:cellulose synthase/poly-beta-1,6-N-acetylglucosamine synthase-like glycosyltransferase